MDAKTILTIWEKTFSEKVDYLSEHLADDLVIEFMGKDSSSQTKDEHIAWSISDESPTIGDFKVIFEENGVAVGTHTAVNPRGEGRDIMYYGKFENNKVTEWKVLVSVHDESQAAKRSLRILKTLCSFFKESFYYVNKMKKLLAILSVVFSANQVSVEFVNGTT